MVCYFIIANKCYKRKRYPELSETHNCLSDVDLEVEVDFEREGTIASHTHCIS